jgi:hypothetical protein
MIGAELVTMIKASTGVTALIGSSTSCKFYPVKAPLNIATPYCVFFQVSPGRTYTHSGYAGFQQATFQISCFHTTQDGVVGLSTAIIAALEAWKTSKVKAVFIDEERWLYEEETKFFHNPVTFTVVYEG